MKRGADSQFTTNKPCWARKCIPPMLIFKGKRLKPDLFANLPSGTLVQESALLSNTTHELQPLDKAVYRSLEHHWDSELLTFFDQK